jgi:hypothetical protein
VSHHRGCCPHDRDIALKKASLGFLGLAVALAAGPVAAQLTDEQKGLYEFWNNAAKKHCSIEQLMWEGSRDKLAKLLGKKKEPTTLPEHQAFAQLHANRAALSECKGDYWLHFLITPKLICDEAAPVGCK